MLDAIERQEELEGVRILLALKFGAVVGEKILNADALVLIERQHAIVEDVHCGNGKL